MYSIKKVSEMLDIPTVTIRAWENRYQVINPTRSKGGHRLYNDSDIETLKWLKNQVENHNMKISEAVRTLKEKESNKISSNQNTYNDLVNQLYDELINFNISKANSTTDLAFSLYNFEDVFYHILVPVLHRVGDEWEKNRIVVAQEHFASQFIMQRCTEFLRILPINGKLPKAIAFCPEGELHHIGLLLYTLFLRKKGMEVIYLGSNTPLNNLKQVITSNNVSLVAISLSHPKHKRTIETWVDEVTEELPHLEFVVGGDGAEYLDGNTSIVNLNNQDWESWYKSFLQRY